MFLFSVLLGSIVTNLNLQELILLDLENICFAWNKAFFGESVHVSVEEWNRIEFIATRYPTKE